jgi:hypothetical protein
MNASVRAAAGFIDGGAALVGYGHLRDVKRRASDPPQRIRLFPARWRKPGAAESTAMEVSPGWSRSSPFDQVRSNNLCFSTEDSRLPRLSRRMRDSGHSWNAAWLSGCCQSSAMAVHSADTTARNLESLWVMFIRAGCRLAEIQLTLANESSFRAKGSQLSGRSRTRRCDCRVVG